jgi:hypothetical protein
MFGIKATTGIAGEQAIVLLHPHLPTLNVIDQNVVKETRQWRVFLWKHKLFLSINTLNKDSINAFCTKF